jgi:hypothetical protein
MTSTVSFVAGLALILAGCALAVPHSPPWVVLVLTAALLIGAHGVPLHERDRMIIRAFAGIPFVIALASTWFWSGVIAQCGILGLLLVREEVIPQTGGPLPLLAAGLAILVMGAVIDASNHTLVPFLVVLTGVLGIIAIFWVQLYRLKRTYRSGST